MRSYADSAATTPLHPEARRVMDEWNQREFGNASSLYAEGRRARAALDEAHETLAQHWGSMKSGATRPSMPIQTGSTRR